MQMHQRPVPSGWRVCCLVLRNAWPRGCLLRMRTEQELAALG